jgi:hypothetical protein
MALPGSGVLGVSDIVDEFGGSAPHGLSEYYRGGGLVSDSPSNTGVPTSGTIAIGDFYGAASAVLLNITIASNTNNYDLYTAVSANPAYVPGATTITATINSGVTVGSTSSGTYAFSVPSAFGAGDIITVVNNGTVLGAGGSGGNGVAPGTGPGVQPPGNPGGNAVYVNRPTTINNAGTLAGAGGGGGSSGSAIVQGGLTPKGAPLRGYYGGAGGGGGAGVNPGAGGGGSAPGPAPGSSGSSTAGGAGGGRYTGSPGSWYRGAGGTGGARGANGAAGEPQGPAGPTTPTEQWPPGGGGTAGRYMTGNPFVTWSATGTRQGGVS